MPVVDTTQSFATGDTVTSTTLNNIMDQSIFVAGAVVTGDGLTVTAGGQMTIENLKVTGAKIGNLEVSTEKIANASITPAKLSSGGPSWTGTGAGGVFSVPQTGLEFGTGHTQDFGCFIDLHSAATATDFETRIVRDGGVNGAFRVINNGTGAITFSASGGATFGSANMPNPVGNAPIFGVRAWAVIGLSTPRTVDAQANIASATRSDQTHTQVTFTTGMDDTSYVVSGCVKNDATLDFATYDHQTTGFKIRHSTEGAGRFVQFMVIR
jgi:hypothetical protein